MRPWSSQYVSAYIEHVATNELGMHLMYHSRERGVSTAVGATGRSERPETESRLKIVTASGYKAEAAEDWNEAERVTVVIEETETAEEMALAMQKAAQRPSSRSDSVGSTLVG